MGKIRERLTVKIDVKDAIFGGTAIYVSVFLITALIVSVADYAFRYLMVIDTSGEIISRVGVNVDNIYSIFFSVVLTIFLITFFTVVLFDETLFSKHEKSLKDLLGLGVVWGSTFIVIDTLIETLLMYMSMFQENQTYYALSIKQIFFGFPYWIAILYIVFLPAAIFYLRKNHKEHMEKVK